MIRKKVCMLGAFAVGKTSLVQRYVCSIFSERYLTTVGVKVDTKDMQVGDVAVKLVLWDLHGEDEFQKVRASYLRGSSAFFLVVDGTRRATLTTAKLLRERALEAAPGSPCICLVNKSDLSAEFELDEAAFASLREDGWTVMLTSAKTGEGVEEAFVRLTEQMLEG